MWIVLMQNPSTLFNYHASITKMEHFGGEKAKLDENIYLKS